MSELGRRLGGVVDELRRRAAARIGVQTEARVIGRVQKMSTNDIFDWTESALTGIGRSLMDFRRGGRREEARVDMDPDACLSEAIQGCAHFGIMLLELERRREEGLL